VGLQWTITRLRTTEILEECDDRRWDLDPESGRSSRGWNTVGHDEG